MTPLDAAGKVPVAHLPKLDYLPVIQRGAPDGVAPLDAQGKVPAANLPAVEDAIPLAQKGQPNGVAALAADGKVPAAQLPLIESIPMGFVAWAPKRGAIWAGWIPGDGQLVSRATFPDLAAASPTALFRSCPRPSGWRIRSSVALIRSAMGQPPFACRTTTASPQARLARRCCVETAHCLPVVQG
ncbi:hypothetical protein WJ970_11630 [Achromobacter xylosoxidans]